MVAGPRGAGESVGGQNYREAVSFKRPRGPGRTGAQIRRGLGLSTLGRSANAWYDGRMTIALPSACKNFVVVLSAVLLVGAPGPFAYPAAAQTISARITTGQSAGIGAASAAGTRAAAGTAGSPVFATSLSAMNAPSAFIAAPALSAVAPALFTAAPALSAAAPALSAAVSALPAATPTAAAPVTALEAGRALGARLDAAKPSNEDAVVKKDALDSFYTGTVNGAREISISRGKASDQPSSLGPSETAPSAVSSNGVPAPHAPQKSLNPNLAMLIGMGLAALAAAALTTMSSMGVLSATVATTTFAGLFVLGGVLAVVALNRKKRGLEINPLALNTVPSAAALKKAAFWVALGVPALAAAGFMALSIFGTISSAFAPAGFVVSFMILGAATVIALMKTHPNHRPFIRNRNDAMGYGLLAALVLPILLGLQIAQGLPDALSRNGKGLAFIAALIGIIAFAVITNRADSQARKERDAKSRGG